MKRLKGKTKVSSQEFDKRFDKGEDMGEFLNVKKAQVHREVQRVNIDFPADFLMKIDEEARRIGVARTALIKLWLSERLQHGQ